MDPRTLEKIAWLCSGIAIVLALPLSSRPDFWTFSVIPWALAGAAALTALRQRDRRLGPLFTPGPHDESWSKREAVTAALLLAMAALARGWNVGELPLGILFDEAGVGTHSLEFLRPTPPAPFHTSEWWHVPNFQLFYISLWMRFIDDSYVAVRLANAFLGWLSVAGGYLLLRRLLGRTVALTTLALTVCFHWNVHYSRGGLSVINGATLTVWTLYFFSRGLGRASRLALGAAGFLAGIGLMAYWSNRAIPLVCAVWWALWAWERRPSRPAAAATVLLPAALALLAFSPMALHYLGRPDSLFPRENHNYIFAPQNLEKTAADAGTASRLGILAYQARRTFGVYCCSDVRANWYELNENHLFGVIVPFFLLGIALSLARWRSLGWRWLWSWFLLTEVLGNLLHIMAPMSFHSLPISSVVLVFAAASLDWARERLARVRLVGPWPPAAAVAMVAVFWATDNWTRYGNTYGANRILERESSVIEVLRHHPDVKRVTYAVPGSTMAVNHVGFQYVVPGARKENLENPEREPSSWNTALAEAELPALIVTREGAAIDRWLRERFPQAQRRALPGNGNSGLVGIRIP